MIKVRLENAYEAMEELGLSRELVGPVLKDLLKLYDDNWKLIEADNYRTLADAIFQDAEEKEMKDANRISVELESKDSRPKRPYSALQNEKTSTNKAMAKISSDLARRTTHPSQTRNRAEPARGAIAMGSSQRDFNIKRATDRVSNATRDRAGVDGRDSRRGSVQENRNLRKETESFSDDREAPRIFSSQQNVITKKEGNHIESSGSRGLVVPRPPMVVHRPSSYKNPRKIIDIAKGTEKWKISMVDESGEEPPVKFMYIRNNIVYQDAYIRFSLARIADDECCSKCKGDCLSYSVPCECASSTKGEFAYTPEGVLRENFLDECIAMNINPQPHHNTYCKDCPLERAKDGSTPGPCKGHLVRNFIKECWSKCGCDMDCGNRVVQRGISCKLQVFSSPDGKGWGLRALHDLPRGAFVCEYVGEILTNMELYERNKNLGSNVKHTYPVLLDADWSSESVLEDKDALCLDATRYGNVARFINHRCYDSNLLEIPVEIESPDHHYYHIAFFTKRKVAAFEELTWDYRIDFNDHTHPIKAFRCFCGSEYCRDPKAKEPMQERRLICYGDS